MLDTKAALFCCALLPLAAGCAGKPPKPTTPPAPTQPAAATRAAAPAPPKTSPIEVSTGDEAAAAIGKRVRITGVARDAKLSAVVAAEALHLHCIEIRAWPEAVSGKRVVVTGRLETTGQFRARVDDAGAISQGTEGDVLVLRDVRYQLAR